MKYIKKGGAPISYLNWHKKVAGTEDEHFENGLRNPEKSHLKKALIREQGHICAYTMRRISIDSSHIEHIKPESICRQELIGSDLDFTNMVACFPRDGMQNPYKYGAPIKNDWWDEGGKDFVSPLNQVCEARFLYDINGNIHARSDHPAAKKTIDVLKLDHKSLTEDRSNAINEFIFGDSGKEPLSPKQVEIAISRIYERNSADQFTAYCVAIHHALLEFQQREEKRRKAKSEIKKAIKNKK